MEIAPGYLIRADNLGEVVDTLGRNPGNEERPVTVEYCCAMGSGHYIVSVQNEHGVHCFEEVSDVRRFVERERAEWESIKPGEATCVYDATLDGFRIRTEEGATVWAEQEPDNYWTLDEIRACHGVVTDNDTKRRYRVTVPSNLFDNSEVGEE